MAIFTLFQRLFGVYLFALGWAGIYDSQLVFSTINKTIPFLNQIGITALLPTSAQDEISTILWGVVSALGAYYTANASNKVFATNSVLVRMYFSSVIVGLIHFERLSSGFGIFVLQDVLSAFLTLVFVMFNKEDDFSISTSNKKKRN